MFLLRSWTQPDAALPYHVACDACKDFAAFASERERWAWSQAHVCASAVTLLYLPKKKADAS